MQYYQTNANKIKYFIFWWWTQKTLLRFSQVRMLNVLNYNHIHYMHFIFNVSLESVSLCHPLSNMERKQPLRVIFLSFKCIGSYETDQPASEMSSIEENKIYLFLRSHRNTYFTSHRYDLGRAEEPLSREFFCILYYFFPLQTTHYYPYFALTSP